MTDTETKNFLVTEEWQPEMQAPLERSDRNYERLEALYEIAKILTSFESVEKNFSELIDIVTLTFPIRSVTLVENRRDEANTGIWMAAHLTDCQIAKTVSKARINFCYLAKVAVAEGVALQLKSIEKHEISDLSYPNQLNFDEEQNLLCFPLATEAGDIFGILQFDGLLTSTEEDLRFTNAFSNIFAVAFDRRFRTDMHVERVAKEAHIAANERDESIKFAEQLAEERSLRERFVQMLSHDLRTPLSAVSMTAQLLKRSKTISKVDLSLVEKLIANSKRLDHMVETLLDANRLKAGEKLPVEIEECDFKKVIQDVLSEQREFSGREIELDCPENVRGYWDGVGLRRLAENLVGNAIKYGAKSTPIRVSLKNKNEGVIFVVHNEGNIISHADQKTLFEQFRRTKSAVSGGKAGWGLGLTLVKGLCEAHGGSVSVESEVGLGTSFFVKIPNDSRIFQGPQL